MTTRVSLRILALPIALSLLLGQAVVTTQVNTARPAFTEASVKALDPSIRDRTGRQLTTTTFVDRTDLLQLIVSAYLDADGAGACATLIASGHECPPIVGPVPAWVRTDKFEITAKLPSESLPVEIIDRLREFRFTSSPRRDVYPPPVQLMLQRLLEETFDLKVRRQRREIPVWAIKARTQELSLMPSTAPAVTGMQTNGLVLATRRAPPRASDDRVTLVFEGSTLKDLTDFFSFYLDRPVIDLTGLEGDYNFTLEFKGGDSRTPWKKGGVPVMGGFDVARLAMAFNALGLAIEPAMAPFEVLVIERVQRPSSN